MQVGYGLNYYGSDYGDPNGTLSLISMESIPRLNLSAVLQIPRMNVGGAAVTQRVVVDTVKGSI
jgi:hypothetical protein